ncbi:hypothetical protein MBM_04081 [Drepanopeziza brunnea f. sp. 'multigermtubi' MB_m1]|uniref:Uncharacterized protein n=1 Tax=Marssonina brunnea f. sp. multigermtubi (strain MB_m1) TaxID=1072389 RepID=K1WYQ0_MARBU|nr:uncharacterized protein MBM_04081 [Drepanopeziza brunnea f. sp. 'multigermtubi' MB_m1]EKD17712.1 hypothetical protein MBM_04081 [Drepanopeziza brunnea f. sp. 'multigermtubi' MB_m1]
MSISIMVRVGWSKGCVVEGSSFKDTVIGLSADVLNNPLIAFKTSRTSEPALVPGYLSTDDVDGDSGRPAPEVVKLIGKLMRTSKSLQRFRPLLFPMHGKPHDVAAIEAIEATEEQQYPRAMIAVRADAGGPFDSSGVENIMNRFSHFSESDGIPRYASLNAPTRIDTFYILMFAQRYGTEPFQTSGSHTTLYGTTAEIKARLLSIALPTSIWNDKQRIPTALLRSQLHCELFRHPDSKEPGLECYWEESLTEQEVFWVHYEWWEVEEVNTAAANSDDGITAEKSVSHERGLTQLRHFINKSIARAAAFGYIYLNRFFTKQFHGFYQIDTED